MKPLPRKRCGTKKNGSCAIASSLSTRNQCVFSARLWVDMEEHMGSDARIPGTPKCCFGLVRCPAPSERNFNDRGDPFIPTGCGECPDPIPECQEGEALTVHKNTTELCCPLYQCGESHV